MSLEGQTVQVPLLKGLNNKVDQKQIPFGEMSLLENAIFKTVLKYQKRNGYTALPKTVLASPYSYTFSQIPSTIDSGKFAAAFKNEKLMDDGFNLFSFSESDDDWAYRGRLQTTKTSKEDIFQNQYNQYYPDSAYNSTTGLVLYAWESYSTDINFNPAELGIYYTLKDYETGAVIYSGNLGNTDYSRPRCVAIGSSLYLFYYDDTDQKLKARSFTSTAVSSATDIVTNINATTPNYDILVNNSLIYVGYNGTGSTVKIASFNSSLVNQASVSKAEVASNGIGIFSDASNNIWCAYNNATDTKAFIMNSTLVTTVLAPTTVEAGVSGVQNVTGIHDGTRGVIFYDQPGLRVIGQDTTVDMTTNLTQPAVGSTTTVTVNGDLGFFVGQPIYINDCGDYFLENQSGTTITIKNLGGSRNVAPTTVVVAPRIIFPLLAYSDAKIRYNTLTSGGTAGTADIFSRSLALSSRAFLYDGVPHVFCAYDSNTQPTNFLCSLYNINTSFSQIPRAHYAARIESNNAGGIPRKSVLANPWFVGTTEINCAMMNRVFNLLKTGDNVVQSRSYNGIFRSTVELSPTQIDKVQMANNLHVASGSLMMYDGEQVVEHGFHVYPTDMTASRSGSLSGRVADGTYSWCVVYSWTDSNGQVHRSAPSNICNYTVSGGNSLIVLVIPTLRITQKQNVIIEIYRTAASGSVFYRIDSNYVNTSSYPVLNFTTTDTVQFSDIFSDDEIIGNQQLYTTGEVENIVSPSPKALSTFKNRLMVVSADDPTTVWYSKQVIPGSPVELSDFFVQNTEQTGGAILDTVQMDDKEIIFKGENLYYVVGSGPAPSGVNNDFTDPTLIATDVGLVDQASIVVMPDGVMFKTQKGIYLLDRSLQVSYIGAQVEDYNQYTVSSAKLIANVNQIRFMLSSGQAIVYDYFVKQWAVFTNHSSVDSMISDELFYYLKSDGTLLKETPGVCSDNGSFISMKARTGWIQFANVQGFQRIWEILLLGEYKSAHTLQVQFEYDGIATVAQTMSVAPGALTNYEYSFSPNRQKCTSMRLTVQDVELGGVIGESYTLSNIAFYVGIKKGLNKVPVTQRAT